MTLRQILVRTLTLCAVVLALIDTLTMSSEVVEKSRDKKVTSVAPEASLFHEILSMLYVSYLVQDIALFNHWEADAAAALQHESLKDPLFFRTLPRTASEVLEWLQQNMDILKRQQSVTLRKFDPDFDLQGLKALVNATTSIMKEEATIEFFNDEFGFRGRNSKPVYGILRNPSKKRLVLVFRGSVNPRDWEQDFAVEERKVSLSQQELERYVPNPNHELLQDFDHVHLHAGFHDYLFDTIDDGNGSDDNKSETMMDEIVRQVMTRLNHERNRGYSLHVSGHSLGGALATNAACTLALSNDVPLPIKLITFASPSIGKQDFVRAFNELEKKGRIQHLRITNHDDIVPQGLSIFGHRHTGIHLNLKTNGTYTINTTSIDEVGDIHVSHKLLLGNPSHRLQEHKIRLDIVKEELLNLTFDGLFENPELRTWLLDDDDDGSEGDDDGGPDETAEL